MTKKQGWLALAVVVVGILLTAALGTYTLMSINDKPLHPDLGKIPAVRDFDPAPRWANAAKQSRTIARQGLAQQNLPGLSVAVGVGGAIVWAEGFGWANLEDKTPVDPETQFRIGHVSVPLTSAAAGRLVEEGRLHLDADIQEYVPAFPVKKWPVTLRDLMGHVAGVIHYRDDEWGDKPSAHCGRASDGLQTFARDPLLFEPETRYHYSTYGWVLVSAAIEAAAGQPFFEFMRANVFKPLGMDRTGVDSAGPAPGRATSYFRGNFDNAITTGVDYSCFAGGGAFLSTPSDLVRFGMGVNGLLQPETLRRLQSRQLLKSGKETDYGLGWMLDTVDLAGEQTRIAGHSSRTMEGASTSFWVIPDRGLVVAVASNMSFADMRSIALAIAQAFVSAK